MTSFQGEMYVRAQVNALALTKRKEMLHFWDWGKKLMDAGAVRVSIDIGVSESDLIFFLVNELSRWES